MPAVNRHEPERRESSESSFSLMEFMREFPDDDACLEDLWRKRYSPDGENATCPKCEQERLFKRYKTAQQRQCWTCTGCGHHVHPTAGTIFHKSSTSLVLWYYAMYLLTSTRCGISAKQLERQIGVNYKTAWRMLNVLRNRSMADDGEPLMGGVEVDETSVEGKPRRGSLKPGTKSERMSEAMKRAERERATVFAAVERGGRAKATVLPSRRGPGLKEQIVKWVRPESIVFTDEWSAYNRLDELGYDHSRVRHAAGEYVIGDAHTNTVEGFFGHIKTGIRGTYKKVSHRWLQGYLNEFVWRRNAKLGDCAGRAMFMQLVDAAASR
jgi:transposase-like protein